MVSGRWISDRDAAQYYAITVAGKDAGRLSWLKQLSDKVCTRPFSAANKASSTFLIPSNDFHEPVQISSCRSRKLIFHSSLDFKQDLTALKTSTTCFRTKRKVSKFQCRDKQFLLRPDDRFLLQFSIVYYDTQWLFDDHPVTRIVRIANRVFICLRGVKFAIFA